MKKIKCLILSGILTIVGIQGAVSAVITLPKYTIQEGNGTNREGAVVKLDGDKYLPFYKSSGYNSGFAGTFFPFLGLNIEGNNAYGEAVKNTGWFVKPPYIKEFAYQVLDRNFFDKLSESRRDIMIYSMNRIIKSHGWDCHGLDEKECIKNYVESSNNEILQHLIIRLGNLDCARISYRFQSGVWRKDNDPSLYPFIQALEDALGRDVFITTYRLSQDNARGVYQASNETQVKAFDTMLKTHDVSISSRNTYPQNKPLIEAIFPEVNPYVS